MSQKLKTVNVLECTDKEYSQYTLHSFVDNKEGNEQAEELFIKIIKENGAFIEKDDDRFHYLDEGIYEIGTYSCVLIHS